MPTVLVVDDEELVTRSVAAYLEADGVRAVVAGDAREAERLWRETRPDAVVLDVRLPGASGLDLLRRMRLDADRTPVVLLSGLDTVDDRIIGLELGADDYLTKPYSLRELLSRIKALLRRAYGDLADAAGGRVLRHRDLVIDLERRRVQRGERRISLTPTEFEILRHLASRPGRVYTRGELLELLRDYEALDQDEKTINVHVSHLREKIEDDPTTPAFVLTVRGVGYAFAER